MDKPAPTREQLRQLVAVVLELLAQDMDTWPDSPPPPGSAHRVDDIELGDADDIQDDNDLA